MGNRKFAKVLTLGPVTVKPRSKLYHAFYFLWRLKKIRVALLSTLGLGLFLSLWQGYRLYAHPDIYRVATYFVNALNRHDFDTIYQLSDDKYRKTLTLAQNRHYLSTVTKYLPCPLSVRHLERLDYPDGSNEFGIYVTFSLPPKAKTVNNFTILPLGLSSTRGWVVYTHRACQGLSGRTQGERGREQVEKAFSEARNLSPPL